MSIDAATVIASAVISAVISTGVALATGPTRAARDERGKRACQARRDVRSAVSEHLAQVKDYRAGIRGSLRRASSLSTLDDALFCASVLRPAADLSPGGGSWSSAGYGYSSVRSCSTSPRPGLPQHPETLSGASYARSSGVGRTVVWLSAAR